MEYLIGELLEKFKENTENHLLHQSNDYLTHRELDQISTKFANYLRSCGITKGDRIGISMDLGFTVINLIFGILKIGAIYVPVDKTKTRNQLENILVQTDCKMFFADYDLIIDKTITQGVEMVLLKSWKLAQKLVEDYSGERYEKDKSLIPEDPAYIIFTSGTTGDPKGVVMPHRSVTNFTMDVVERFRQSSKDRTICRTPPSFDPFLTEILPSVISGGQIFIQDRDESVISLLKLIEKEKITNFGCGPSLFELLFKLEPIVKKHDLSSLREIYFGYEKMSPQLIKFVQRLLPDTKLINGYGTSESFAATTYYEYNDENGLVFLGEPIKSSKIFLWDSTEKKICEDGEMGEIIISGRTLMKGYWNNDLATNKVLRENPANHEELALFTGDIGQYVGRNIIFIGRLDNQLKLNGLKINPEEIQEILYKFNDIKEAVVCNENGRLVCYYNRFTGNRSYDDIVEFLSKNIEYKKVPTEWRYQDQFERNSNSKIIAPKK